jgi:hypothetical protein
MLKVESFKISDAVGINALLSKYRLASGAHILVSDGQVCIPYEDGEPDNAAQRTVALKEQQNTMRRELDIIIHSNKVLDLLIADAGDRMNVAKAAWDKARSNKALEKRYNETADGLTGLQNTKLKNEAEIVRLNRNIEMFDEQIKEIGS